MGSIPVRPCPACGEPLTLGEPLVTCPSCDRDYAVEIRQPDGDPYRDGPLVGFRPATRPPPAGARVRDLGTAVRIGRGARSFFTSAGALGVVVAVIFGPGALLRLERAPAAHVRVLALLLGGWGLLCLAVWGLLALLWVGRREEVWLADGVIGWWRGRFGVGLERLGLVADIERIEHSGGGAQRFVSVVFRSGEAWPVGREQHQPELTMAWLARRLHNATRAA